MASWGYDSEIFAEPPEKLEEYKCPVCLYIMREPHLTRCGHHFCLKCIEKILAVTGPCPVCKTQGLQTFPDKNMERKILALRARCRNTGCSWSQDFSSLEHHLSVECTFSVVPCTNRCGQRVQRGYLSQHLREVCPMRLCHCMYCGFTAQRHEVSRHWAVCEKYPVPCPNNCQVCTIERGGLEAHLSQCPLQSVSCDFSHYGCTERLCRRDVEAHMEQKASWHLSLLASFSRKSHERLLHQEQQLEELQSKLAMKDTQVRDLWGKLATRDSQVELLRRRVDSLEMCLQTCSVPPFVFTLSNVAHYMESSLSWNGPSFYTHQKGPKLKIRIFFSQAHKEMAIKLLQLPCENDGDVRWPHQCTVKFYVLDQMGHRCSLENSNKVALRQCRGGEVNVGILRWPYNMLYSPPERAQYLKEDCILFRVQVTF